MTRIRSSIALVVGCVWALGLGGAALAADMAMPTKAPPPPAPPPLDIHGFVEWDWESFLINPQGQALIPQSTVTVVAGLDWVLYHNKAGWINKVTVGGGGATDWSDEFTGYWAWFDSLSAQGRSAQGALFDVVMFIDGSVTFGQYWTLTDTFYNVYSQDTCSAVNTGCLGSTTGGTVGFNYLLANELKLSFNDSFTGWPITFNPYVTWFAEWPGTTGGTGFACFTCAANGSDFFIGMTPTVSGKLWGMPWLTVKAPTYVTVGDSSFWGTGIFGGPSSGGVGIFTTGLTFIAGLGQWIPANLGNWYAKAGFQYYDIINTALQQDNAFSVCASPVCGDWETKNIIVGFAGVGVAF